jgi:hypothetical protein
VYFEQANCKCFFVSRAESTLRWYEARDLLLGQNGAKQNIRKALNLASVCDHADAVWLTSLFAEQADVTTQDAQVVFFDESRNDPRGLVFGAFLSSDANQLWEDLRQAADLG